MKHDIITDSERLRILKLHESYKNNLNGFKLLSESEPEKIVTSKKIWDYKQVGNKYYARKKGQTQWILATGNAELAIKKLIFSQAPEQKSQEPGKTLPSLVSTGFKIDRSSFDNDLGYYVRKCSQTGCAEFTYDMIGNVFGDAWQAYSRFQKYANVTPDLVKKMTDVFNSINKNGMPTLNDKSENDSKAKSIIQSLIPSNQKQFNNLPLGAVVGLFYPASSNFDLAFFQSAVGMSRDNNGNWVQIKSPYFCKQQHKCDDTLWKRNDENKNIMFSPDDILKSGKSFIPNTHIGFIGYIDNKGERYVVHQVHQKVYAYPVSKMTKNGLAIIWAGTPKIK